MRGKNPTRLVAPFGALGLSLVLAIPGSPQALAQDRSFLEEITVTAQRREENLQEVPFSVSAIKGDSFQNLIESGEDVRALANRIPGLYAESSNGRLAPRFYMRGLGNTDFDLAASQSVSVVVDEVVQENVILKSFPLFDIDRVEVLRGPQGTLFGRNTPAGIIKFETRRPTAELDGYVNVTVGSYGTRNIEGAVGGSLNSDQTLMGRFSVLNQHRDDWIGNGYTREDDVLGGFLETAWRGQLLWEPNDEISALLNLHGRDFEGTASIFRANILSPGSNQLNENFIRDVVFFDQPTDNPAEAEGFGGSLRVDWNIAEDMTLTSITSHEEVQNSSYGDIDGGFGASFLPFMGPGFIPFPAETRDGLHDLEQITQEIRLAHDASDDVFWQAGFFYFKSDFTVKTEPFFVPPTFVTHKNEAWAVFGQVELAISDSTRVTAGARLTDDQKDMLTEGSPNPQPPVDVGDRQLSWDVSLMHDINDDMSVYLRVANGFRAPTIQGRNIAFFDPNPYSIAQSETILSTEIGLKSEIGDRARVNAAVYHYRIEDQQLSAIGGNANSNVLVNAEEGIGMGIDVDAEILLSETLTLVVGASVNDTEINDPNLVTATPCLPSGGRCTLQDPVNNAGFAILDGNPFPQAPKSQLNINLRYQKPIFDNDQAYFVVDHARQGDANFFLYESAEFHSGNIHETGLRAGFIANDGQWELAAFARNFTDEKNLKGAIDFNNNTGFVNEPRIFGVNFRMSFGD